jgi:hypothetical protein
MPDVSARLPLPGDPKYIAMVWAGLIDDPNVLEEERQRRATSATPTPKTPPRRVTKREGRWIPIGRSER